MPSSKRRLEQIAKENVKVAKSNMSISAFFQGTPKSQSSVSREPCTTLPENISTTESTSSPKPKEQIKNNRNNSGHASTFNGKWKEGRPWLVCKDELSPDGNSYQAMYCSLCLKLGQNSGRNQVWTKIGCTSLRLDSVNNHEKSSQHKSAMASELSTTESVEKLAKKMGTQEFSALKDAQKVLHFLIQHNLPHTTLFKPSVELCVDLGATNLPFLFCGKNAMYTNHEIVDEFLECQAKVVEEKITEKVNNSKVYGIMLDEYTDVSSRKHLALVGKYLDNGVSQLAFLQDIQLPNGSADVIYTAMKDHLKHRNISFENLTSFSSDGPSVMVGKKNGVVAKLKRDNSHVIPVHCINHRLQLAVSKAFHSVRQIDAVDELLTSLFKYYHFSTVKSGSLDAIQNLLRSSGCLETENNLTIKRAVHTRWLSHENAVLTVRKLFVPICKDLENAVAEGRDKKLGETSGVPAAALLKNLRVYDKVFYIHLLCDVCTILGNLTRVFEKDNVDLSLVHPKLQAACLSLEKLKSMNGPFTSKVDNLCSQLDIPISDTVALPTEQFINNILALMEERLQHSETINALSALDLRDVQADMLAFHGDQDIVSLCDHLGMDADQTLFEWSEIKDVFRETEELSICSPDYMLQKLTKKENSLGNIYPNINKLLSVYQTLILSTATVERDFSKVKLIVTDHRNRLKVTTTNRLLTVAINTTNIKDLDLDNTKIKDLDLDKVVNEFLLKKNRRIL